MDSLASDAGLMKVMVWLMARALLPPEERGGESAHACLEAIRASFRVGVSFDNEMRIEGSLFEGLLRRSLQGRAYRHVFFTKRLSSLPSSSGRGRGVGCASGATTSGWEGALLASSGREGWDAGSPCCSCGGDTGQ